ncbi:MAG: DMT family transporter [Cyanobacteria bacterium P01_F01_bin.150]
MATITTILTTYPGELAALGGALLWAIASTIYTKAGQTVVPLVLNLVKGIVAIAFMLLTLGIQQSPLPILNAREWLLLMGSGIVGIGIGDTVFFMALNSLGARRTILLEALAPPLAALLAIAFLGEVLGWTSYIGILLTVLGVTWVVLERTASTKNNAKINEISSIQYRQGIIYGLLAALCQATGAVMTRAALVDTTISPLWSGLIRLIAGTILALVLILGLIGTKRLESRTLYPLRSLSLLGLITMTSFASTFLAIWLQQTALKYTAAGIAQALTSTSPLFVIPFAMMMGDRITVRSVFGVFVALGGVWLLFLH